MSQIKVNTINDANGGSNAVLYGVAAPANSMGFRNRILNGGMVIDQRNAGASITPTVDGVFSVDRWQCRLSQSSKYSVQQNAGAVTPPAGFSNYLGFTSLSAYTVGASEFFSVQQPIEGYNVSDFGWGTANAQSISISFWVRSSLTGTFGGTMYNSAGNRCYPFSYTISVANTWEYKTILVPGDTTGTWLTNNGIGLLIAWGIGAGASVSGTAGSWGSTLYRSATGATSVVGTNGATFYITGVQLEAGTVASPFERRDYGRELMMCQRYFENAYINCGYGVYINTTYVPYVNRLIKFNTLKRAAPSITFTVTSLDNATTPGSIPYANPSSFHHISSAANAGFPYNSIAIDYSASSEL